MTPEAEKRCLAYARTIRNRNKRSYAEALIRWWSDRDNTPRGKLGAMGSQAVYMRLTEIVKETDG